MKLSTKNLKGIGYGATLRPSRDWLVLIALLFIGLLVSVGWNLWTFKKVTEGNSLGAPPPAQDTGTPAVDSVHALFEQRAAEEGKYRNEYRFVDPSR